ncbi:MAG TPA: glucoamylase family protein, partial [Gemmataceae bacterium]|nr:glucoamylase family protein [Gemmataceae bacterium]
LLSALAAHDFGYLSTAALAERVENAFATFERLDRFRGHFYNWYDTQSLGVLEPAYVSTVDSGNLLGCLLTLRQGLLGKAEARPGAGVVRDGLLDALRLAAEQFHALEVPGTPPPPDFQAVEARLAELSRLLGERPADLLEWDAWLARLELAGAELTAHVQSLAVALNDDPEELRRWADRFVAQLRQQREELDALAPWLKRFHGVGAAAALGTALAPEMAARWRAVVGLLTRPFSLAEFAARQKALHADLTTLQGLEKVRPEGRALLAALAGDVDASAAPALRERLQSLADRAGAFGAVMAFRFLYNEQRHLFSIGYSRAAGRLDGAHYDLLASEAALTSFLAIARGDAPKRHWFQLGRQLTRAGGGIALMSWGGTMFEYLMPRLLLPNFAGTLLDESAKGAVGRQIEYGRHCRTPWGISESGFNALDAALDYQYQSFGVPGLGLKRGLSRDLVIAPYATMMALMVRPHAALENVRALRAERGEGPYGMYEAIDYTRDRLREKRRSAVVRSFMAHHQGMSLVALANCLLGDPMPRRFHDEPMVRATELLLQERVPRVAPLIDLHEDEAAPAPVVREGLPPMSRRITTPHTPHPRTQVLSGGRYTVMLTNAGSGASTCADLDVTRWREDRTCDAWGQFCYVHDRRTGELWSAGYQPVCREADSYEVTFSTDKAEFRRRDGHIETHLEVTVSPENAAEIRRVLLTNYDSRPHELELTSYAEVVLLPHRADIAHPAFGKLFLETEFIPAADALLCRRRPRSADQKPVWCVHVLAVDGPTVGQVQWETDRARFLGRGRTPARPAALEPGAVLSGTTGPVLDPVVSLRRRVRVAPGASVCVAFTTAVAKSREEALALADHYHDFHGVNRAFELAWAHTQVQLRHLHLSGEEAHLFQRLAAFVLYAGPALRAPATVLSANRQGQQALWRHGISGDKPIVLARVSEADDRPLVRQLLLAHAYWRLQGLEVDLVLLNEHASGYIEELQQELLAMVRASDSHGLIDKPGGVFVRKADHLAEEDKVLLQSAARVVLAGNRGSLAAQVDRHERRQALPNRLNPAEPKREAEPARPAPRADLVFANGVGGFTPDGREYVLTLAQAPPPNGTDRMAAWRRAKAAPPGVTLPPAPWCNVIANPRFGFLVSEAGGGYTWAANSQMNRLTPWSNDPVSDPPGEAVYLRDEATGEFWTPTPLPLGPAPACAVRHGQGYTVFEQDSHGLRQELLLFVPAEDPVKVLR